MADEKKYWVCTGCWEEFTSKEERNIHAKSYCDVFFDPWDNTPMAFD